MSDPHPSKWSPAILEVIAMTLHAWQLPVHDPFAGTGERLGKLCDSLGLTFTGTEIEPEYILDPRVVAGDSTERRSYPDEPWGKPYCIATSPVYPNGMTDHFNARDASKRYTYRQALAQILGHDRPLHNNNMGRYGGRGGSLSLAQHYAIAERCVVHWPDRVIVNVSDFLMTTRRGLVTVPVVDRWRQILEGRGYSLSPSFPIKTPRSRNGKNRERRAVHEVVIIGTYPRRITR